MSTNSQIADTLPSLPKEGLTVTRSDDGLCVRLPRLTSSHQQLTVIWQLHEMWSADRFQASDVVLDVSAAGELPLPVIAVLSAIEQDLRREGGEMKIKGDCTGRTPKSEEAASSDGSERIKPLVAGDPVFTEGVAMETAARKKARAEEMNMTGKMRVDDFERELLGHVEMLYGVALKLTKDPRDAEHITRSALQDAWKDQANLNGRRGLKAALLKTLRRTFQDYRRMAGLRNSLLGFSPSVPATRGGKILGRTLVEMAATS